ncbi:chemotaxis protein CheW [Achromobacter sp. UMC46]|uniref:chemotaxis protein CheW n=1 Tax=Achromobacter sp. UMC46 TaxID=1862319 RepID=UPI0016015500|nr:chemotaxis protein CheW [Achromobacter sp. UMC46]MBB1594280.1 chemotaxis protein CheW [Achromobacter sp. UMC46]
MAALAPSLPEPGAALAAARRLYLLFRIGEDRYALDAADVVEVLGLRALKQVPSTPEWVAGMLDRRGVPVPVIDMSALAGHGAAVRVTSTRLALVRFRPDAGAGTGVDAEGRLLGLILEQATETVHYDPAAFRPYGLDNAGARYLGPVLSDARGMVQAVKVGDLLPAPVRTLLFPAANSHEGEASP